jgi:hypothetical protein
VNVYDYNAELIKAAVHWWKMKRPQGWTLERHEDNPLVNCASPSESRLARIAVRFARERLLSELDPADTQGGR